MNHLNQQHILSMFKKAIDDINVSDFERTGTKIIIGYNDGCKDILIFDTLTTAKDFYKQLKNIG